MQDEQQDPYIRYHFVSPVAERSLLTVGAGSLASMETRLV